MSIFQRQEITSFLYDMLEQTENQTSLSPLLPKVNELVKYEGGVVYTRKTLEDGGTMDLAFPIICKNCCSLMTIKPCDKAFKNCPLKGICWDLIAVCPNCKQFNDREVKDHNANIPLTTHICPVCVYQIIIRGHNKSRPSKDIMRDWRRHLNRIHDCTLPLVKRRRDLSYTMNTSSTHEVMEIDDDSN